MRKSGRITLSHAGALLIAAVWVLAAGEGACRRFLLKDMVPKSEDRFLELMQIHGGIPALNGQPLILGISDSFGCVGEPGHSFLNFLENELKSSGFPNQLLNISVTGYQPIEELQIVRDFGLRYHPSIVLHGLYVGNDLDGHAFGRPRATDAGVRVFERGFSLFKPSTWIFPEVLFRSIRLWRFLLIRGWKDTAHGEPRYPDALNETDYMRLLRQTLVHFHKNFPKSPEWKEAKEVITEMIRITRLQGATYVMAALPDALQVEDELQQVLFRDPRLHREDYDFTQPQKLLKTLAKEQGVPLADLYPEAREQGSSGGLYLFREPHWSEKGNQFAGKALAGWLSRSGLLPGR
jgi:hypothetical protein